MDKIHLENMLFYCYHGVSDFEKKLGGKFEIDLDLYLSLKKAGKSDSLLDTVDYAAVYKVVNNCSNQKKYSLIESLGETICETLFKKFPIDRIKIRVRKLNAPLRGVLKFVEIELDRRKNN